MTNAENESSIVIDHALGYAYFFTTRRGIFNSVLKRLMPDVETSAPDQELIELCQQQGLSVKIRNKAYSINKIPIQAIRSPACAFRVAKVAQKPTE
jgi:hypothetical protein